MGYRLAMIVSGGVALIWTDPAQRQGGGWTWPEVYRFMAGLMAAAALLSASVLPRVPTPPGPRPAARNDLLGFAAVLVAVAVGYLLSDRFAPRIAQALLGAAARRQRAGAAPAAALDRPAALLLGIGFTLPLAAWAARRARFETLLGGLAQLLQRSPARPPSWR